MLKVGDRLIIYTTARKRQPYRTIGDARRIAVIYRVSKLWAYEKSHKPGSFYGRHPITHSPDTLEDIEVAEKVIEGMAEQDRRKKAEQEALKAARDADPRTPYIDRFRYTDFENWDSLTLEQLQTLAGWLDKKVKAPA